MDLIRISRKPFLSLLMAFAVLFVSCEQYDQPIQKVQNKFDYTVFNIFKSSSSFENILEQIDKTDLKNKSQSVLQKNRKILAIVNSEIGANLELPDLALELSDKNPEEMLSIALDNNWMSNRDLELTKEFNSDLKILGFNNAVKIYEEKVLNMNLTEEEFISKNNFINTVKSMNYYQPNVFKSNLVNKSLKASSWWRCAIAITCLTAAVATIAGCATGAGCLIATVCLVGASLAVADNC